MERFGASIQWLVEEWVLECPSPPSLVLELCSDHYKQGTNTKHYDWLPLAVTTEEGPLESCRSGGGPESTEAHCFM